MQAFSLHRELPGRIAILNAQNFVPDSRIHLISILADFWRADGIEVVELSGTQVFVPADVLIVHVDRSVVPASYAEFALQYPLVINAGALDIRKHLYADGLLDRTSSYDGPVIVKSNLNFGGAPERSEFGPRRSLLHSARNNLKRAILPGSFGMIEDKTDYRIFQRLSDVPADAFSDDNIVQMFQPEMMGNQYALREYYFLFDRHYLCVETSDQPIFTEDTTVEIQAWTPPPELLAIRQKLGLEYGKIDFVMAGGKPFVFDANKTMGLGRIADVQTIEGQWDAMHGAYLEMASGLSSSLLDWYELALVRAC